MKFIQMLVGFIRHRYHEGSSSTKQSITIPIKSLLFIAFTFVASAHAETLSLVTYYGKTGGIGGDLNATTDKVNGISICPSVNTNSNSVPGCDFSDDSGYQKNDVNDPTDDTYTGDLIVRNNDQFEVIAGWSITGGNEPITLTAVLPDNTVRWESLPSSCKAGSSISADGKTMVCVRSGYTTATVYSEDIPFNVVVKGGSPNGHVPGDVNITIDSDNGTAKQDAAGVSIITTASPRWNLQQSLYDFATGQTHNGVDGAIVYYKYYLEAAEVSGAEDTASTILGNESLGSDFTLEFDDDLTSVSPNTVLILCRKDSSNGVDPYAYFDPTYPETSVATPLATMVQTCTQPGGAGTTIHIKHEHIDASLDHIPTKAKNGTTLPVTRAIAAIGTIRVFIPFTDIEAGLNATDTSGTNVLATTNRLTSFDPDSISGQSNFGAENESVLDNIYSKTYYGTAGSFGELYVTSRTQWWVSNAGGATGYRSGDGIVTPGANWASRVNYYNSGGSLLEDGVICDIFDANTVDVTDIPGNTGQAMKVHYSNGGSDAITGAVYEYATGYVGGSWPPNPESKQSVRVAQECGDASIQWHSTTTAAKATGAITKIRVRFVNGLPVGTNAYTIINLTARSNDLNGNPIPMGTIISNYATVKDASYFTAARYPATDGWWTNNYQPRSSVDVGHLGGGGDRLLLVRGKARVAKNISQSNLTTGDTLNVTLTPTFTCDSSIVENSPVKIIEMMGEGLEYVAGSSSVPPSEPTIGSCADLEEGDLKTACTANHTVLVWDLGTKACNTAIPDITFNTQVAAGAPVGTLHTYTMISAATDGSDLGIRTANKDLNISIPSALIVTKETTDAYFDAGDVLNYTVHSRNGTATPLTALDMIDILPFNGDGTDGFKFTTGGDITSQSRTPASNFEGTLSFTSASAAASCTGVLSYKYTNKTPKNIDISPTANSNKPGGSTTWCDGTATGPGAACGFNNAAVTALRVTGADLGPSAICSISINIEPTGYAINKLQRFSNSAGVYAQGVSLPTLSNLVTIAGQAPVTTDDTKSSPDAIAPANTISQDVTANDTHTVASVGINKATVNFDPASVTDGTGSDTDNDGDIDQVVVSGEGTWTVDANGIVTFTPIAGFTGRPSSIQYDLKGNNGFVSNKSTVTVTYTQPPVAVNDSKHNPASISPSNPTILPLIAGNDSDTDGTVDPATIDLDPATDGIQNTFSNTEGGWSVDGSGNVTFVPAIGLSTNPQPINYTINDNDGNTSNIATLTVTYGYTPVANNDEQANPAPVSPQNPTTLSAITGNDTDADPTGSIDLATVDLDPATDGIQNTFSNSDGQWEVNATGDVTFTPSATLTDNPSPITYTVNDNDGTTSNPATLTVTYGIAPVATSNEARNTAPAAEDNPTLLADITANDTDADGTIDPATVDLDPETDGIQKSFTNDDGTWTVSNTGDATFTPNASLTGNPAPINYVVADNDGNLTNITTLTVIYGQLPVAVDDVQHNPAPVAESNPTTLSLMTNNDSDADGEINPATVDLDLSQAGIQNTLSNDDGVWNVDALGNVTFTPSEALVTSAGNPTAINYTVNDNVGNTSNIATLTVTYGLAPVAVDDSKANRAPVATANPTTLPLVAANDSDPDGVIDPATVDLDPATDGIQQNFDNADGNWSVTPEGNVTFTPNAQLSEGRKNPQSIPYTVQDNDGNTSNIANLTIVYGYLPVADNDSSLDNKTTEAVTVDPLTNDSDENGELVPATVVLTSTGVSADGKTLTVEGEGVWTVDPVTGAITFTPETGFTANPTPVTYMVQDNDENTSNEATVTITYLAEKPVAVNDSASNTGVVAEDNPTTLPLVTTNDSDSDGVIDPATVDLDPTTDGIQQTFENSDGNWSVTPEGNVTFTPNAQLSERSESPQPIAYTVNDNDGNTSNTATLTVTYGNPPVATDNEKLEQTAGTIVTLPVATDDSDPDGDLDPSSVKLIDPATGNPVTTLVVAGQGTWTVNPNSGDISFAPETGYTDDPTPVKYTISDQTGKVSNQATVTVTYSETAALVGTVWLDRNKDGQINPDERRMANWTLEIKDMDGNVVRTVTTDDQGNYAVEGLAPEEYTIDFYNERGVLIASKGTGGPLEPTAPNARPFELLLPIDPSGVIYNSTTRQPIQGVQMQLLNSNGIVVDPACVGSNQQNQVTGIDGMYAFDVNPAAHATCPTNEVYTLRIASVPSNYHGGSALLPRDTGTYQGAPTEAGCTVDAIAASGSCEVQAQADAPTGNQSTRYFTEFDLQPGDLNIIFNHIPLDEVGAGDILISKRVNKQQGSVGDMFFYTIEAANTTSFSNNDIDIRDNIPAGFALVSGSSKLTRAGVDGQLGTADDVKVAINPTGTDPMTYNDIDFASNETVRITYMMRAGATAIEGKHVNTAQALNTQGGPASNIAKATVTIIAEATLDQSSLIGKVFHDRDGDGYQDAANITGITISAEAYTQYAGGLTARVSVQDNPAKHRKVIRVPLAANGDNSFKVETQQGTSIHVDGSGQITEMHRGMKARGLTAQQLQVTTRKVGDELEITLTNLGINEEGIPGVRLATVKGLVIETDGYGRYHIPDVDAGRRGFGKNFIIKVDKATLPKGSVFTTENPRVLRLTGAALNKINFGVKLPNQQAPMKRGLAQPEYQTQTVTRQVTQQGKPQTVTVNMGSIFFDKDKHHIRADQRGTMDDIAAKILQYGHGHITIDAFTDSRHNAKYNIALAERRANTVRKELKKKLGGRLMRNVKVDVDTSAFKEIPHNDPHAIDYNKAEQKGGFNLFD